MKEVRKSKLLIYLSSILQFQGFIGPIIYVFYTMYMGLSISEYLFCDALLFIIMAIVEIPSGMIADYFGRKKILLFSKVAIILGMTILLFTASFNGAVIVAVIYGTFGALESGIENSIFYELFEKKAALKEYEFVTARSGGIGFIVSIIYSIAAGYLVQINVALPVILDLIICVILFIAVAILLEDVREAKIVQEAFRLPSKKELLNIIPIILFAGLMTSVLRVAYSFYQPILTNLDLPTFWLGYAAGMYNIISSISAFLYAKIRDYISKWYFMIFLIIMQIIGTIGIAYINMIFVVVFIIIQQLQRGIMGPFMYMQVNSYIDSNSGNRVTLMSVYFCITTIMSSALLWLISIVTEKNDLYFSLKVFSIFINIVTIIFFVRLYWLDKHKKITQYINIEKTNEG